MVAVQCVGVDKRKGKIVFSLAIFADFALTRSRGEG